MTYHPFPVSQKLHVALTALSVGDSLDLNGQVHHIQEKSHWPAETTASGADTTVLELGNNYTLQQEDTSLVFFQSVEKTSFFGMFTTTTSKAVVVESISIGDDSFRRV